MNIQIFSYKVVSSMMPSVSSSCDGSVVACNWNEVSDDNYQLLDWLTACIDYSQLDT